MSRAVLDRTMPRHHDAEITILGAILVNNNAFHQAAETLTADDFYTEQHRHIFRSMADMLEKNTPVDLMTIQDHLMGAGTLAEAGGIGYISGLMDGIPHLPNIDHYIAMVKDKSILRQTIHASNKIMSECFEGADSADAIVDRAEQAMFRLAERRTRSGFVRIRDLQPRATRMLEQLYNERRSVTGLSTGFHDLDMMTSGLQPADLIIIAARPSQGKTALALNIAAHVGIKKQEAVGIFSLEMSKEQLLMRLLCSEALTSAHKARTGFLSREDYEKMGEALTEISNAPIFIDDSSAMTLTEMRAKARKLKAEHGLKLLIVDYLQLMSGASSKENRTQEVSGISRGLKALAKELDVPVVALSQLSRAPEQRHGNHKPQLSDLRESGSIEQDADVVAFIYREELYAPSEENAGHAELILAKQRNGPIGVVRMAYLKQYTRFENLMEGY